MSSPEKQKTGPAKRRNPWPEPEKRNHWEIYSWEVSQFDDKQKQEDVQAAFKYARDLYDELRPNDRWNNLNGMRNREIAELCAEEALEHKFGRSIAAFEGADKLGEMVWEHFNEEKLWIFPGRD